MISLLLACSYLLTSNNVLLNIDRVEAIRVLDLPTECSISLTVGSNVYWHSFDSLDDMHNFFEKNVELVNLRDLNAGRRE